MLEPPFSSFNIHPGCPPRRLHPADTLERMHAIAEYAILDTPGEAAFDSMAQLAAEICQTAMAAISLVCDDRQWFKATHGMTVRETPVEQSICAYAIDDSGVYVVSDAASHPTFVGNELVSGSFHLRFYAGVAIHAHDGVPIGALCVIDTTPRPAGLTTAQAKALATLGKQVEAQLELRRSILIQERRIERERRFSRRLEHAANHDGLTGLPNRSYFLREFQKALNPQIRPDQRPALLLVDLDNFKAVNDSRGHAAGDSVLIEAGRRLKEAAGEDAMVGRVGGDEFAVMIRRCPSYDAAAEIVRDILEAVNLPLTHEGRIVDCQVSIGYALAGEADHDPAALFRKADLALGAAKSAGRGRARRFSSMVGQAADHERDMIERARTALADGRVQPYYQPKVNLDTGELVGFEALLRIVAPDGDISLPATIAAAFEDRDLAVAITDRMIGAILSDLSQAHACGLNIGHVAINTTSFDFAMSDFAGHLLTKLATRGIPSSKIEVEVTESVVMGRGRDYVRHSLAQLAEAGVSIALDDFGTGYASLTNVKQLPISALKIDRSFVSGLGNAMDDSIILAMATLGMRTGLKIVAEGVESAAQIEMLRHFGVPVGQGMYFSPAVPSNCLGELARIAASGRWGPNRRRQGEQGMRLVASRSSSSPVGALERAST